MHERTHHPLPAHGSRKSRAEVEIGAKGVRGLVADLQQKAGNRATTSFLQRFSKKSLKKSERAIRWLAETTEVIRLAGGKSGGAYEAFSEEGTLVIKPLLELERTAGGGPEQQQFADVVLDRLMKLRAPRRTRVVAAASPEGAEIIQVLTTRIKPEALAADVARDMSTVRFFRVMEKLEGITLESAVAKAATVADVQELARRTFGNPDFMRQLGRLVVGDALIGNTDRLDALAAGNLGNIMLPKKPKKGFALIVFDTEVKLPDYPASRALLSLIDDIFDNRAGYFRNFETAIRKLLPEDEELQTALTVFLEAPSLRLRDKARTPFDEGIDDAINATRKLSAGLFSEVKELKRLAGVRYESPQAEAQQLSYESAERTRWDRLKLNQLYLALRAAGLSSAAARKEIDLFARHREARLTERSASERKAMSKEYERGLKERLKAERVAF